MARIEFDEKNINLQEIKENLQNGKIIVYPTDTVYGVGASIESLEGIEKIYAAKQRSFSSPLIALVSDKKYVEKIAKIPAENFKIFEKLAEKYWPGALTIILEKKEIVPPKMISGGNTIGVRVPNLKISREIIEAVGGILPTTSANISGEQTPKNYNELDEKFLKSVDIIVKDEITKLGVESTIVDLTTREIKVLREGAITKSDIENIVKEIN